MLEPALTPEGCPRPDVSHLVTEDGSPVDGTFSERQMRLLTEPLYASWPEGRPFVALANVGLFSGVHAPVVVPDVLLSLGVTAPEDPFPKEHRSYFVWEYGKPPDMVIEVVSNEVGGEEEKLDKYARIGVAYCAIYDPEGHLGDRPLRVYELHGRTYVEMLKPAWLPQVGLGLRLWTGSYQDVPGVWLRWCRQDGTLLDTGVERAEEAEERAEEAEERAEEAQERAEKARERADKAEEQAKKAREQAGKARERAEKAEERAARLAARLKELGIEEEPGRS